MRKVVPALLAVACLLPGCNAPRPVAGHNGEASIANVSTIPERDPLATGTFIMLEDAAYFVAPPSGASGEIRIHGLGVVPAWIQWSYTYTGKTSVYRDKGSSKAVVHGGPDGWEFTIPPLSSAAPSVDATTGVDASRPSGILFSVIGAGTAEKLAIYGPVYYTAH